MQMVPSKIRDYLLSLNWYKGKCSKKSWCHEAKINEAWLVKWTNNVLQSPKVKLLYGHYVGTVLYCCLAPLLTIRPGPSFYQF